MSSRRTGWRACATALVLLTLHACGGNGNGTTAGDGYEGWNILLLTIDTTRADRLGLYEHEDAVTPNLDRLADRGFVFDNAVAHAPLTLPTHSSILTGLLPPQHGVRNNGTYQLDNGFETLAEVLSRAGYQTAATVAAFVLDRKYGLAQGFDSYDDRIDAAALSPFGYAERSGAEVTDAALAQADDLDGKRPFFLWAHYFDPHAPYSPPPEFRSRFPQTPTGRYDAEIASMDAQIGRLLDGLDRRGKLDRTLIFVISDHGEGIGGPHEEKSHGIFLYEETVRAPFIISSRDGLAVTGRTTEIAQQVDVMPTVLDLVGVTHDGDLAGASLRPLLEGATMSPPRAAYAETFFPLDSFGWAPLFTVRTRDWKYIEAPSPELYDLVADPQELTNLAQSRPEKLTEMKAILADIRAAAPAGARSGGTRDIGAADAQRLENMGYQTSGASHEIEDWGDRKNPRDWIAIQDQLEEARLAHLRRDLDTADRVIDDVLRKDPDNFEALGIQATLRLAAGNFTGAEAPLRRLTELLPGAAQHWVRLGGVYQQQVGRLMQQGDRAGSDRKEALAAAAFQAAIDAGSNDVAPHINLGVIRLRRGDHERAAELFEDAVDLDSRSYPAQYNLARALLELERFDEALATLDRAAPLAGNDRGRQGRMLTDRADAHAGLEQWEQAVALYKKLLREHPDHPEVERFRQAIRRHE